MEKPTADLDLKLMPDWLKEAPSKNPYADYEVREERPRRDFGDRSGPPRGPKRNDPRGPKSRDEKRPPQRDGAGKQDSRRGFDARPVTPRAPVEQKPAPVKIEFLPEPMFVESIARQAKTTTRAYPLFELARMFLQKPERHRVRITSTDANLPLFQAGEGGPVAFERAALEKTAFNALKSEFYVMETTQREPLKGNFTNVARCKLTGTLLGPTNYHGYQPALRKLYDERFSRRMPFPEFQREIEVVTDAAVIEAWKEEARGQTVYKTREETDPLTFASLGEAEQHFRKTHLENLIRTGPAFEISGEVSRQLPDRQIANAVRQAWEDERAFPGQLMFHLRQRLSQLGLQIFKHRKRMQFFSVVRPEPFKDKNFSPNIAEILRVIETTPKCTRATLAAAILKADGSEPDPAKAKALASDLHWLIDAGRVIEFHDGLLEMPFEPKASPEAPPPRAQPISPAQSSSESAAP